ncbi:MAG: hypothetical protein R3F60_34040 [bacterium]
MKAGPDRRRRGCPTARCKARRHRWLDHPHDCTVDEPLCHRFDCELVDVFVRSGCRPLGEIERMSQRLQARYALAQALVSEQAQAGDVAGDLTQPLAFLDFIRRLHATVFRDIPGAGAWRSSSEHATFDHGAHRREGVRPEAIEGDLIKLHARWVVQAQAPTMEGLARCCAAFLVGFFAVAPVRRWERSGWSPARQLPRRSNWPLRCGLADRSSGKARLPLGDAAHAHRTLERYADLRTGPTTLTGAWPASSAV